MSTAQAASVHEAQRAPAERQGLVVWAAQKFGVDAGKVFPILKQTCFRGERDKQTGAIKEASDAEVAALMIVAREHGLNPFLKEIYAFPDKRGGIVPVVGIDGWIRIVNEHPAYDGVDFIYEKFDGTPAWIECHMFRKDRTHPIQVREFLSECRRDTTPWQSHPARMLRHKTYIQCARVAFGFAGIFDPDEADAIIEGQVVEHSGSAQQPQRGTAGLKTALLGDGLNVGQEEKTKHAGTPAEKARLIAEYGKCADPEILALAADGARDFTWSEQDAAELKRAYDERAAALKG